MRLESLIICASSILWIDYMGNIHTNNSDTKVLIENYIRYKNAAINLFFNFLDICFGIFVALLLFYGGKMYL